MLTISSLETEMLQILPLRTFLSQILTQALHLSLIHIYPGWDAVILARAGLERLGLYAPETLVEGRKLYMLSLIHI